MVNSTNQLPTNDGRTSTQERGDLTSSLALHNDQVLLGSMVHSVDLEANVSSSTDDHDNEVSERWDNGQSYFYFADLGSKKASVILPINFFLNILPNDFYCFTHCFDWSTQIVDWFA